MAPSILPSTPITFPVPAGEKHPHNLMLPPPCFNVGMVPMVMNNKCLPSSVSVFSDQRTFVYYFYFIITLSVKDFQVIAQQNVEMVKGRILIHVTVPLGQN